MEKILFIDAAVRAGSRTRRLAEYLIGKLNGEPERLVLETSGLKPLTGETLAWRDDCIARGDYADGFFRFAHQLAEADTVVIAAPFWDGSFPSMLKVYIENVSVSGLTFRYTADGIPQGLCRAKRLFYVTTAGGAIYNDAYGYGYIRDTVTTMFGIPETHLIKAENLDLWGADPEKILSDAEKNIDRLIIEA